VNETELRELMERPAADPQARLPVAALLEAGRRSRRRHRAAAVAGGVLTAAVAAAGLYGLTGVGGPEPSGGAVPAGTSPSTPSARSTPGFVPTGPDSPRIRARLGERVTFADGSWVRVTARELCHSFEGVPLGEPGECEDLSDGRTDLGPVGAERGTGLAETAGGSRRTGVLVHQDPGDPVVRAVYQFHSDGWRGVAGLVQFTDRPDWVYVHLEAPGRPSIAVAEPPPFGDRWLFTRSGAVLSPPVRG
jgi:hypothetical protein